MFHLVSPGAKDREHKSLFGGNMKGITDFILYLGGEPLAYFIGGSVFLISMNVARGVIFGDKRVSFIDLVDSIREVQFKNK